MTKWQFTNYKGEQVTWYSGDVIDRIREFATAEIIGKKYNAKGKYNACETILNFLNEIDEVKND